MKALVYRGEKKYKIEEKPTPKIKSGEILLKVVACGICGTDLKIFNFGHHAIKPPITTGHEIVGEVVEVKNKKTNIKIGDKVLVVTPVGCMKCDFCKLGKQNMCSWVAKNVHSIGYYTDGGFAEYIKIPKEAVDQNILIKIPKTKLPLEHFSVCEPLSCVINGQEKLKIKPGDTVVVMGAGPIGCMHVYLAKSKGAKKIILADITEKKLQLAKSKNIPANIFVNNMKQNLKDIVMKQTKDKGADVIIIAAPSGKAQEEAIEMAAIQGRISFFGGLPKTTPTITLTSNILHYRELEVYGAFASSRKQYEQALEMVLQKKIATHSLITHILPLKDIKKAVDIMLKGEAIKIVITP